MGMKPRRSSQFEEVHRIARTLDHDGTEHRFEDIVLMHYSNQIRPWGFARVPPQKIVQEDDVFITFSDDEFTEFHLMVGMFQEGMKLR